MKCLSEAFGRRELSREAASFLRPPNGYFGRAAAACVQ